MTEPGQSERGHTSLSLSGAESSILFFLWPGLRRCQREAAELGAVRGPQPRPGAELLAATQ